MTTQIIATIGKNFDKKSIFEMHKAGANIFRYNFSHGNHKDAKRLRKILFEEDFNRCSLIGDIAGPEVRLYNYPHNLIIKKNQTIKIYSTQYNTPEIKVNLRLDKFIPASNFILISDGLIRAELLDYNQTFMTIKCFNTKNIKLRAKAHIAFPGSTYPIDFLNEKDIHDIEFCMNNKFEYIALSFVQNTEDILAVRQITQNSPILIIVKFELPQAITNIDSIIRNADAFFIARGDLGNECNLFQVPYLQSLITKKCSLFKKPVFLATQILESMITNPNPLRAELTDIAYAIKTNISALTLSGETAYGKYPLEAIKTLKKMIDIYSSLTHLNKF